MLNCLVNLSTCIVGAVWRSDRDYFSGRKNKRADWRCDLMIIARVARLTWRSGSILVSGTTLRKASGLVGQTVFDFKTEVGDHAMGFARLLPWSR
jgi:hypothetical protein